MLKLNPRHVHRVHLRDGAKEGTHDITIAGFNDQQMDYEITLRGIAGPGFSEPGARVIRHIQNLDALGSDAHISYKYPVLLLICNFVGSFFEPHYKEE